MADGTRKFFRVLNKYFMVPMYRLGLGGLICNPLSGYIMVMKVRGRKTGKLRYVPVNYALYQGNAYCVSGYRRASDWYKNLMAAQGIEVMLPGSTIYGTVSEETDTDTRLKVIRQVLQNAGFAGFFEGYTPWKISDDELKEKTADIPLIKISPVGVGSGAVDPAGWGWISATVLLIVAILLLIYIF
jgi:deazaflavin-dependent oxidoreductase (nitroreductase family)